jgi:acyl transferase domain-containing protein/NAD(P)H-dependent flavin oxidoreductase YrpB (nitropropane dioxygenase family)/NAD(P)-dependent dehydrogenase (short-subunit alcohol dehydrogenase family)
LALKKLWSKKYLNIVYTPAGSDDATLAIAACRAGGLGVLNAEFSTDPIRLTQQIRRLTQNAHDACGLKLGRLNDQLIAVVEAYAAKGLKFLILDAALAADHREWVSKLRRLHMVVLIEVRTANAPELPLDELADGVVVKGNEAGGLVGENSSFILLQKWRNQSRLPIFVHGGITPQVAAGCAAIGAAGGVLDSQILMLEESPLAYELQPLIAKLNGSETLAVGSSESGEYFRLLNRPDCPDAKKFVVEADGKHASDLKQLAMGRIDWRMPKSGLLPVGQDVCFAGAWRRRYGHMIDLLRAIDRAVDENLKIASKHRSFSKNSPLARSLEIPLPVVQGPMARVSDNADFAEAVSLAGGLPTIAMALSSKQDLDPLLAHTAEKIGNATWGVGILGFAPPELLDGQMELIEKYKPRFAVIAGGQPEQVLQLEKLGIKAFVHVQSQELLPVFMQAGARRFIFEGRECGGHVGPLSSFVLWSRMVECLTDELDRRDNPPDDIQILFAGGIHNAVSAAFIAVLAAPLVNRGVEIGLQMGTSYLFTKEIVSTGALDRFFQKNAVECEHTVCLQSGPGHAVRCAYTSFAKSFLDRRLQLLEAQIPGAQCREQLEKMMLGRLRLASKGCARLEDSCSLQTYDEAFQQQEGLYMLGQTAILRQAPIAIAALHREVTGKAMDMVARALTRKKRSTKRKAPKPADIAIIGMACLLPKADGVETYWDNILNKSVALMEIPDHRWDWRLYFTEDRQAKDSIYSRWGGFMDDLVFEPARFGIPPKSVASVDTMQLMALEVARRTLADAGYEMRPFDRERASVIIGCSGGVGDVGMQYGVRSEVPRFQGDLSDTLACCLPEWTEDTFAGILPNVVAGRIANRLDLGGVNFTTDAACASSMAAIYQGVVALTTGGSDFVITGGVDTSQSPFCYMCFSQTQALSPRGVCDTFDKGADGIVIAEGIAMIAMKRLCDAERDGDRIYAVIKGVGAGSDGRAKGLTAPEPDGQLRAMQRAYDHSGFGPDAVTMFEAHGTGTVAGDTAELESTTRLLKSAGCGEHHAAIGSVKTLIGHTKATAGAAGLIKAALALHHRVLPPHFPVKQPNSILQQEGSPLYLSDEAMPWFSRKGKKRRAAASAFGFGGTNFHVVLEAYDDEYRPWIRSAAGPKRPAELFVWAAEDRSQLADRMSQLRDLLGEGSHPSMQRLALKLAKKWTPSAATMAFVALDIGDLKQKLDARVAFLKGDQQRPPSGIHYGSSLDRQGKLAVLFSGQGAQYTYMFRELAMHFPVFRRYIEQADELLEADFRRSFAEPGQLSRFIYPRAAYTSEAKTAAEKTLRRTDIAQPALGAVGAGLWELMRGIGLDPDMLAGHSYGEFLALYATGFLDFPELMRLSQKRGRLIVEATEAARSGLGTMAAVQASREVVQEKISGITDLVIANHNAPAQCVVAGSESAVQEASDRFEQAGIFTHRIPVAAAFHSPLIQPAQVAFADVLAKCNWQCPDMPIALYSNTIGDRHPEDSQAIKEIMIRHLVEPVEFVRQIEAMYRDGARVFVELGPKSVLTGLVRHTLRKSPHTAVAINGGKTDLAGMLDACGQLLCAGVKLEIDKLFETIDDRPDDLHESAGGSQQTRSSKSAWIINGAGARPIGEPVRPAGRSPETQHVSAADKQAPSAIRPNININQSNTKRKTMAARATKTMPGRYARKQHPGLANGDSSVMAQYFETMRHFLQTQEAVMAAYMGTSPAPNRRWNRSMLTLPGTAAPPDPLMDPAPRNSQEDHEQPPQPMDHQTAREPRPGSGPMGGNGDSPPVPAAQPSFNEEKIDRERLTQMLLTIVEDKTGYPQDMLGLDQNLEGDLGIDSIKRVEIASALLNVLPPGYRQSLDGEQAKLNTQATLNGMVEILSDLETSQGAQLPFSQSGVGSETDDDRHPLRYIVEAAAEPMDESAAEQFTSGVFVLTQDSLGLTEAISELLNARGCTAIITPLAVLRDGDELSRWCKEVGREHGSIAGIVHMAQAGSEWLQPDAALEEWRAQLQINEKSFFTILHDFSDKLKADAHVVSVSALGGYFNRRSTRKNALSLQGGFVGLLKSLAQERPELKVKAIDVDPELSADTVATILLKEMAYAGGRREVGYPEGHRTVFKTVATDLDSEHVPLPAMGDAVILVTGGARGVTAETIRELALQGHTLLILGRSAFEENEPEETRDLPDLNALRKHFVAQVRAGKAKMNMAQMRRRIKSVLDAREMRLNIDDFRRRGAAVQYFQADVNDEEQMQRVINQIYDQYGHIDGVLHGAGIIEDKLLADKDPASWSRVVDTKVLGLLLLQKYVRPETLNFFGVFSSVAGRYGNSGQTDYATANELMNRLCCQLHEIWNTEGNNGDKQQVKVKAFCWGPWGSTRFGTGMVNEFMEAKFNERGITLVTAEAGRGLFKNELLLDDDRHIEIICGHGQWERYDSETPRRGKIPRSEI